MRPPLLQFPLRHFELFADFGTDSNGIGGTYVTIKPSDKIILILNGMFCYKALKQYILKRLYFFNVGCIDFKRKKTPNYLMTID